MRFFYVLFIVLFLGACAQKQHHHHHNHEGGHDHAKVSQDGACVGCAHHDKDHKGGDCTDCKKECAAGCEKPTTKERGCCSDDKSCSTTDAKTNAAMCKATSSPLENNPRILKNISQEEFAKVFSTNKDKIGQTCSSPAMKYCGKTTKDMNVTEGEMTCLWTKVFRVTRERLPELDGTPCASMIKGFAKNK